MMIRSNTFYNDFEDEMDAIEQINNEEVTQGEQPIVANLNRRKTRLQNDITEKQTQANALQDEIQKLQQQVARIDQQIARHKAT